MWHYLMTPVHAPATRIPLPNLVTSYAGTLSRLARIGDSACQPYMSSIYGQEPIKNFAFEQPMSESSPAEVTRVLQAAAAGDQQAAADLLPLVYGELRRLARGQMAKTPPGNTLQPTALVHEAYLRVAGKSDPNWNGRGHFFAAAAQAMRQILVDQARRKARIKHGGGRRRVDLDAVEQVIEAPTDDVIGLDKALTKLEAHDPRKAQIILLRYFAGLTEAETAAALGLSGPTIRRECRFAQALLSVWCEDTNATDPETGLP